LNSSRFRRRAIEELAKGRKETNAILRVTC
jgi:hypothetical protein